MARFFTGFLAALIGATAANLIILFILRPFVIDPTLPLHSLGIGPVSMFTISGVIGATIVYAVMRAFMARPNKVFFWVSVVVLLLSFIPDFAIIGQTTGPFAGATLPSALTLALMHVVAAVIIVYSLTKLWGRRSALRVQT